MITNPRHKLDFAGLDLTGNTRYLADGVAADWYVYEALAEDPDTGNPEPVTVEQASALFDGSVVELDRWGNRQQSWPLRIRAANSRGLAAGERELASLMGDTPRVLGYEPPDGWGARTVFDVMVSSLAHEFDDYGELNTESIGRHFTLRLVCAPFGYADYEITDYLSFDEPGDDPDTLTISDGTSATNWTGVSVDAGRLKMTNLLDGDTWGGGVWFAQWTAPTPLDPTAFGYLSHTLQTASTAPNPVEVVGYYDDDSWALNGPIEVTPDNGDPTLRTYVYQFRDMPDGATGLARIDFTVKPGGNSADAWIDDVHLTEAVAQSPLGYVHLSGSAPVAGTIIARDRITGEDLLVYTSPALTGGRFPRGPYVVMAKLPALLAGHTVTTTYGGVSESYTLGADQGMGMYATGVVHMPAVDAMAPGEPLDAVNSLATVSTTLGAVEWVKCFYMGEGSALTHVEAPNTGAVYIQDPVLGDTTPGIFMGSETNAVFPGVDKVKSWGKHRLFPPFAPIWFHGMESIEVRHRPAFHHFAADPRS